MLKKCIMELEIAPSLKTLQLLSARYRNCGEMPPANEQYSKLRNPLAVLCFSDNNSLMDFLPLTFFKRRDIILIIICCYFMVYIWNMEMKGKMDIFTSYCKTFFFFNEGADHLCSWIKLVKPKSSKRTDVKK